jgi:thiamine transporter ThiT
MSATVKKFFNSFVPTVLKPLQVLWNQLIAFIFLAFAVPVGSQGWREYRKLDDDPANLVKVVCLAFFFVVLLGFGVHALCKARSINKRTP